MTKRGNRKYSEFKRQTRQTVYKTSYASVSFPHLLRKPVREPHGKKFPAEDNNKLTFSPCDIQKNIMEMY